MWNISGKQWQETLAPSTTPSQTDEDAEMVSGLLQNEWIQAMMVGSGFVPIFWLLEQGRRAYREKHNHAIEMSSFNAITDEAMDRLGKWNICSVLVKVCLLGELYFTLQVGGTKATYVFLSWMNEQLAEISFSIVLAIVYGVGLVMFLLPPVPG